jgi:hypothetical protein
MSEEDDRSPPVRACDSTQSRFHSRYPSRCPADDGVILEIASGSGEHVVHFARNLPSLVFQPSDPEPETLLSVAAWVKDAHVTNVRAPIVLNASQSPWPIGSADGVICINMAHISPWDATVGLITGAASSRVTALSLWPLQTQRARNSPEQRDVRPKPSRSQCDLGSARSGSGRCDSAIRRMLDSHCHRNAREQSERCVSPDVSSGTGLRCRSLGRWTAI